jgi:anti-anti-sigma regulatory factor
MKIENNIAIISLGQSYDIDKLAEIVDFSNSSLIEQVKGVIIDASELININVMGLEVLSLKDKIHDNNKHNLVFYGLKPETRTILEMLDTDKEYGELINFDSLSKAITFIREKV